MNQEDQAFHYLATTHNTACRNIINSSTDKSLAEKIVVASLMDIARNNKKASCSPESIIRAVSTAVALNLMPTPTLNQISFVPFKNELTAMIGYQGLISLVCNDRKDISIHSDIVHENDKYKITSGTNPQILHEPFLAGDRGKPVAYYAVASIGSSPLKTMVCMSRTEMEQHKNKFAKKDYSGKNRFWDNHFDGMAMKTVLKKLIKLLPMGRTTQLAVDVDNHAEGEVSAPAPQPVVQKHIPEKEKPKAIENKDKKKDENKDNATENNNTDNAGNAADFE